MISTSLSVWSGALTILLLGAAVATDLRSRRIPNTLTLTAIAAALAGRAVVQGWPGLVIALSGAVIAPLLLFGLHAGKGLGMGDLKLSAAVGALVGPAVAIVAMLASAVAGGVLAVILMARPGGPLSPLVSTFLIGVPRFTKPARVPTPIHTPNGQSAGPAPSEPATMPYGVAIAVGTLATLAVCWATGNEQWFFTFIT
jgi:prepilin peptidase CpaA